MNTQDSRRSFLKKSVLTTSGAILLSTQSNASSISNHNLSSSGEGKIFFTKNNPGRWLKKVSGHNPVINISGSDSKLVEVTTPHEMNGIEHYIVKHQLLDRDLNVIDERYFDPFKDKSPISKFTITGESGAFYVTSLCNKHDLWILPVVFS